MSQKQQLGPLGESLVARYYADQGAQIIVRNYHTRQGELDLIILLDGRLVFVEVKTRTNNKYGEPQEAVDETKLDKMSSAAETFLKEHHWTGQVEFQVAVVFLAKASYKIKILAIE